MKTQTIQTEQKTGLYNEVLIRPTKVVFEEDENDKQVATISTLNNGEYTIDAKVFPALLYYFKAKLPDTVSNVLKMPVEQKTEIINKLLKQHPRTLKLQLDSIGEVVWIRSEKFEQVSWAEIKDSVNVTIEKLYKQLPEHFDRLPNAWNYKLPIEHKLLDFWIEIWAGYNLGSLSRKSITIMVRGRTITPLETMKSACLNWSTFKAPSKWFNIETNHISKIMPDIANLSNRIIHIRSGTKKLDETELLKSFKEQQSIIEKSMGVIDKYVHTELTKNEMNAIIDLYKVTRGLPKYLTKDLYDLIKEPTIWGLSNAFSFFRTHCDYKRSKKPKEESTLTQKLDFIAGELLVVSPLIAELKNKFGKITKEMLIKPAK